MSILKNKKLIKNNIYILFLFYRDVLLNMNNACFKIESFRVRLIIVF